MNAQQLLEMALLDACGVLEPDELDAFERAFAEAPESVKAQIRREQSRFADHSQLLPNVEPRPELRRLVVGAVRKAANEELERSLNFEQFVRDTAAQGPTPADLHQRRVFPIWRAAAIILGVTTLFGGVLSYELRGQIEDLGEQMSTINSADLFLEFGDMPGLKQAMMSPTAERLAFTPVDDALDAGAAIYADEAQGRCYLISSRLPALDNGRYEIVSLDDDGSVASTLTRFDSNGETDGHEFDFNEAVRGSIAIASRSATGALEIVMVLA